MDEASRCTRVGFLDGGKLLVEGAPSEIASRLEGRMLEVVAEPRRRAMKIALQDPSVQDASLYGDNLRLRVALGAGEDVSRRLADRLPREGCTVGQIGAVPPGLEDVFISLLEGRAPEVASP
jgi:ABC-2 type transport system ATP-binding protein